MRFQLSRGLFAENRLGALLSNRNACYAGYCLLALGLFDDSEVEINDVLDEGDNITFIVRI